MAKTLKLPKAPKSIQKGSSLADLLDADAIACLAHNLKAVYSSFDNAGFVKHANAGIKSLGILQRGNFLASTMKEFLPPKYENAIAVMLKLLTEPHDKTKDLGLAVFFYLPHVCFVAQYGLDPKHNDGEDPFEISMKAQYELTKRFSAEFSIRYFLDSQPERTLKILKKWMKDKDPHVRRLCSEGTRPRLPWAIRLKQFQKDPAPVLPILETLKDDSDLYVRRSVANHLGDIAKDNLELCLKICENWSQDADHDRKWLIRHALRYPAKKGNKRALKIRAAAK